MKPTPRLTAPTSTGTITPKRSESLPISTPPSPNPIMVNVKGSEASPRAMANSACSGGSATAIEYIPEPPIVIKASAAQRRAQAYGDSVSSDAWSVLMDQAALRNVNAKSPTMTASSAMADRGSDQWQPVKPPMIPAAT